MERNSDKRIIIKGFAGLGNRLRTIASGIEYAQKTNRKVIIDWSDGMFAEEGVNAFDKYFILKFGGGNEEDVKTYEFCYPKSFSDEMCGGISRYYWKKENKNFIVRKSINAVLFVLNIFSSFNCIENMIYHICMKYKYFELKQEFVDKLGYQDRFVFGGQLKKNLSEDNVLFVDNVPDYKAKTLTDNIALKPNLEMDINSFVESNELKNKSIGIHIRATDKQYIGNIERLIKSLKRFMKKKSIYKIFLSTDNKRIEDIFFREFGEKLVVYPKFIPEEEKQGIHNWAKKNSDELLKERMTREAVLDMFTLAETEYLLYQFGSTFSEISKVYHRDKSKCMNWLVFGYIASIL